MGVVTIEETADGPAIVHPGLRLRFRWLGDRWTHAIDLGPGPEADPTWPQPPCPEDAPWLLLAEANEWQAPEADPAHVPSPVFQELQFQEAEHGVYALLVGRAGPHHFSGSFFVTDGIYEYPRPIDVQGLEAYQPLIKADIADRCSSPIALFASTYRLDNPLHGYRLSGRDGGLDWFESDGETWECDYGRADWYVLRSDPPARLALREYDGYGPWDAQLRAGLDPANRTQRQTYSWFHPCATRRFQELLRQRDPEYDAQLRRAEAEQEALRAQDLLLYEDPEHLAWLRKIGADAERQKEECRAWLRRMGTDPDKLRDKYLKRP